MRRRPPHLTLATSLAALAGTSAAGAQDLAGTWRVTRDEVAVTVGEWGPNCGPRPTSRQTPPGREVTIRAEGEQLVISGGRTTYRSNRCWSDNREVVVVSASHPTPTRWLVTCSTPSASSLAESGSYRLEARDATHLGFRDETRYEWTIEGSQCRASSVLTREYERVSAAPDAAAPAARRRCARARRRGPTATATATTTSASARARCATPGPAAALQVTPSRRSTTAGERVCLRARFVDAALRDARR